jgi:aspartate oxidase
MAFFSSCPRIAVIGAGIAGLSFALRAARHGSVVVLAKGDVFESNTAWAQGGIVGVFKPGIGHVLIRSICAPQARSFSSTLS